MAIGDMHKKFGEDRTCISGDMIADRHTHRRTDTLITILCTALLGVEQLVANTPL